MTTIVVGGHSRNIGKTSLAAGLIAAFRPNDWTAIKITQYGHGVCSINGRECGCAVEDHPYAILEEKDLSGANDSSRFLVAGARRALWVRTKAGQLAQAMPALNPIIESSPFVMMESNSILRFMRPTLYVVVLSYRVPDFKDSAREFLNLADAAVTIDEEVTPSPWEGVRAEDLHALKKFPARPPIYVSDDLKDFVQSRIA